MVQGERWKRDRRYAIGDHRCPLVVRMALNTIAGGSGEGSQCTDNTTDKRLRGRISTRTVHIARFPFPYSCTPSIQPKFPILRRYYQLVLQWREENIYSLLGQSGATSPRHCEQLNHLNWVFFVWWTNEYSQFASPVMTDDARQTRLLYRSPPNATYVLDRHVLSCHFVIPSISHSSVRCDLTHPASAAFLTDCQLVVVRKRHPVSRSSPPVITHFRLPAIGWTIDPYALGD